MTPPTRRPYLDANSLYAIQEAIDFLATLRAARCSLTDPHDTHDPGDALHLTWTLALQIDAYLPHLIEHARAHGYSWHDIHRFLTAPPR
jgi:hypothetical protein